MPNRQIVYEDLGPCLIPRYSFIRVFNSIAQCPGVDIYKDDGLKIAANVRYRVITPYFPVREGVYNIKIYLAGSKDTLLSEINELQIIGEQIITFVISGTLDNMDITVVIDDINQNVFPDRAKTRIADFTLKTLSFTMISGPNSFTGQLNVNQNSEYIDTPTGEYILEIVPFQRNNGISVRVNISPGRIYTLYILESIPPTSPFYEEGNIYQVIQVVDGNTYFEKCEAFYNQ